ncbi:MAG: stage III sporulation protein AD [Clostridia bacterium]|nr:stage III sporulation protein AD [Clostridia bacterium]MDE6474307.1 stage III sporulation protein AD [Clostridia bacterium]MDE6605680.1 stage III sporulation protein AD [Clostridia bacterium]MDE6870354.1 stage III sporulation protein AD [Clostridia bacterium]MDE7208301.1 stage III sporulation protein AD [Clostridia bacterium]
MDIFKIVGIAIVGCVCTLLLKNTQSQYAMLSSLATGIIILIIALSSFSKVILSFQAIIDKTGVNSELFATLLKIIGIGYITEYSQSVCEDLECGSIGKKVSFAGKIAIFLLALPIIENLINTVTEIL